MNEASTPIKHVVIVGGGTAGWMTANLMASCWSNLGIEITLVESSAIGIVGVGEGSTPQLKKYFDYLDIDESEWMPKCHATYKNGITFTDWSTKPGFSQYFHSFESEVDFRTEPAFFYNCSVRRKGVDVHAHPDQFYLGSHLTERKLGPIPKENFPFKVGYGYHFDASLVGQFLSEKAQSKGVKHIDDKVSDVKVADDGSISSISLESGTKLSADFFVDCTGFSSLLLQQTLKVPFIYYKENLFNDAAVTVQLPHAEEFSPQTVSTALKYGWVWKIPLTNRTGNGYVYSSAYCSQHEAETELRHHLNIIDEDITCRHLKMKVGRVEKHWHKNCLAVGLSQGFIEPLEATALHLVQETIQGFIDAYELGNFSNLNEDKFNQRINERFEGVRDYIVTHYVLNTRSDTDYWKENREHGKISDPLRKIISCWMQQGDLKKEIETLGIDKYYTTMSWHSILAGYGVFPEQGKLLKGSAKAHKYDLQEIQSFIAKCGMNFPDNKELLQIQT